jgi:hypothetical protein
MMNERFDAFGHSDFVIPSTFACRAVASAQVGHSSFGIPRRHFHFDLLKPLVIVDHAEQLERARI